MVQAIRTKKRDVAIPFVSRFGRPAEVWDGSSFTRVEIGQMIGKHPSLISKACGLLGVQSYYEVQKDDIWRIYVFFCWKWHPENRNGWGSRFLQELQSMGDEKFIKTYVHEIGGSKEDCEDMIDAFIAKKNTHKIA